MANDIVNYQDVITDIKGIISSGREVAYNAANKAMVLTYWHVGKRIVEQEKKRHNMGTEELIQIIMSLYRSNKSVEQ